MSHARDWVREMVRVQGESGPQPGELWRHYKGGLYRIVCRAIEEDTGRDVVVYTSAEDFRKGNWTRRIEVFREEVLVQGVMTPRFQRIRGHVTVPAASA